MECLGRVLAPGGEVAHDRHDGNQADARFQGAAFERVEPRIDQIRNSAENRKQTGRIENEVQRLERIERCEVRFCRCTAGRRRRQLQFRQLQFIDRIVPSKAIRILVARNATKIPRGKRIVKAGAIKVEPSLPVVLSAREQLVDRQRGVRLERRPAKDIVFQVALRFTGARLGEDVAHRALVIGQRPERLLRSATGHILDGENFIDRRAEEIAVFDRARLVEIENTLLAVVGVVFQQVARVVGVAIAIGINLLADAPPKDASVGMDGWQETADSHAFVGLRGAKMRRLRPALVGGWVSTACRFSL